MTIEELIQSGSIELYVLNALPPEEAAEIEALAQVNPQLRAEIEEIEAVMQLFAQAHAVTPPDALRDVILEKIENLPSEEETTEKTTDDETHSDIEEILPNAEKEDTPSVSEAENTLESTINTPENIAKFQAPDDTLADTSPVYNADFDADTEGVVSASRFGFLGRLLPWILVAACAAGATYFYTKYQTAQNELKNCKKNQEEMVNTQKLIIAMQQKLDVITNPKTRVIALQGVDNNPKARATVYWNSEREATYLAIQNLPPLPPDKQYQLWGIVNKNPVDAGIFDLDLANVQPMKPFDRVNAFAVTVEPLGGSQSPTLDKMVVLGTL